jgi:hypothetical protein
VPDELAGTSVEASSHKTPATFPTGQLNQWCVCFEHIVGWPTTVRSTHHGAFPPLPRNCSWPSAMTAGNLVFGSRGGRTDTSAACVIRPTEPAGDSRTASFRYRTYRPLPWRRAINVIGAKIELSCIAPAVPFRRAPWKS